MLDLYWEKTNSKLNNLTEIFLIIMLDCYISKILVPEKQNKDIEDIIC